MASSDVTDCPFTPDQVRITLPEVNAPSTTRFTISAGMAKPTPAEVPDCENMAVLIPTRLPFISTSAPPELPGLIEASV